MNWPKFFERIDPKWAQDLFLHWDQLDGSLACFKAPLNYHAISPFLACEFASIFVHFDLLITLFLFKRMLRREKRLLGIARESRPITREGESLQRGWKN